MAIQIIREVTTDVVKRNVTKVVHAKQNDVNSRFLNVRIQEDGADIAVDSTSTVMLNVQRPDKSSNMFYGTVNEDGTVRVPLTSWMLEIEGTLLCDVSIIVEGDTVTKLTTMQFNIYVEAAVISDGSFVETEEYSVIVDLLDRVTEASRMALDAAMNAEYLSSRCEKVVEEAEVALEDLVAGGHVEALKELNKGNKFSVWVGTRAEYDLLSTEEKQNLFAILTDDTSKEDIYNIIHSIEQSITGGRANALSLEGGISIESGDLNNYFQVGNYYIGSINYVQNIQNMPPVQTAGVLKVISGTGFVPDATTWFCVIQIFIAHHDGSIFIRQMTHSSSGNTWTEWRELATASANTKKMSDVLIYLDDRVDHTDVKDRVYLNFRHTVENLAVSSISSMSQFKDFILDYCKAGAFYPVTGGKGLVTFMAITRTTANEIYLINMTTSKIEWAPIDDIITGNPLVYSEIKNYY